MADLPTLADRIEDTEVNANKPMTESLWRKFGSNVNFLLDFLGVSDGETSPGGSLSDLSQAVDLISSHTMDIQASVATNVLNGPLNIGTFPRVDFVNQVFYAVTENNTGGTTGHSLNENISVEMVRDGGLTHLMTKQNDYVGFNNYPNTYKNVFRPPNAAFGDADTIFSYDMTLVAGNPNGGALFGNTVKSIFPLCVLDYRDFSTDCEVILNWSGFPTGLVSPTTGISTVNIYREYRLNVGSLGFTP